MQLAVDVVFARLPKVFKTEAIKLEIAKKVDASDGNYEHIARRCVIGMFASVDAAIANRKKLAHFR